MISLTICKKRNGTVSDIGRSYLFNIEPKTVFLDLEKERLSKISKFFVRKRRIKACVPILIKSIFGKKWSKMIFKLYPKRNTGLSILQ